MKLSIKTFILILSVMFWAELLQAQQLKATARIDSTSILLGDQVKLILEIEAPKSAAIQFPAVPDTLAGLIEVLTRAKTDTLESGSQFTEKQSKAYTITCFDSGSYIIAPQWFTVSVNGVADSVATNPVILYVNTMVIDTSRGLTDIKMPYGAPLTLKEVTPYILGIILIAAIIFLILYSIKRKRKNQPLFKFPEKPKEPAHIIALRELDRIKEEKIWTKEKTKQYYSEVTEVIRTYIEERFDIPAMEQTTDEIIDSFKSRKNLLGEKSFSNLDQILSLADFVKFAKYKPLPDDDNLTLANAYFFINNTKKEEIKKPETPEKNDDNPVVENSN